MANFGKYANLSAAGWSERTATQVIAIGQNAHVGLWGGGPAGEDLIVRASDPSICVTHEEPANARYSHWRHFLITSLRGGETTVTATMPSGAIWASMTVKVSGRVGVRLMFFPGERIAGSTMVGTIYVIGGNGDGIRAAGGPPTGRYDRGGHTIESTPAGKYVLGARVHVVAPSWPMSAIPWGAALRINASGEAEFEASAGKWRVATGPDGVVTKAQMNFLAKDRLNPRIDVVVDTVRRIFIDPATGQLRSSTWERNDFGRWGWNLLANGRPTPYFVHTTPQDERASAQGQAVFLTNSHGCVHLVPAERDRFMNAGFLKQGVPFEVRPYSEVGPP
jgi:hypothetical protein